MLIAKLQDLLEFHPDINWQILIKERHSDRSIEQNSRLWELYTSVGNYLGYSSDDVHDLMGYKFLLIEKNVGKNKITKVRSTTKLSIKEMAEYQEKIEAWASYLGWSWS